MAYEKKHGLRGFDDRTAVRLKLLRHIFDAMTAPDKAELIDAMRKEELIGGNDDMQFDRLFSTSDERGALNSLEFAQTFILGKVAAQPLDQVPVFEELAVDMLGNIDDLTFQPADLNNFQLFVNGQEQEQNEDFTVSVLSIAWISPDYTLTPADEVRAYYTK